MSADSIDRIDEGILYYLQQDARNATTTDMGDRLDVASSTVRNRIDRLEERGILEGYHPEIDYDAAGLGLHVVFTCTSPANADELVDRVIDQYGVVRVRELLGDGENLHVEAVGTDTQDLTRITDSLRELGLEVVRSEVVTEHRSRPYNHYDHDLPG